MFGLCLRLGLALGVLYWVSLAHAAEMPARFRLCALDVDFPPFAKVDGSGHLQYLLQQAANSMGVAIDRRVAPRRRCLEEIRNGVSDGMVSAYAPERAEYAIFPMAGGEIDDSKSLGTVRYYVYRRAGSSVGWDGQRFIELGDGRIGVESGFVFIIDRLKQLGVAYDDGSKSLEPNLSKLVAGRVDSVIGMDVEAERLIASRYAGKIERSLKPFELTPLYLMVSRQFHAQYPRFSERYWKVIQEVRVGADYRQYQLKNP